MPSNRRPSTSGASARPGGRGADGRSSSGRARTGGSPTTSRSDAGTSGGSRAGSSGSGSKKPGAAKGTSSARRPAAPGRSKATSAQEATGKPASGKASSSASSPGRRPGRATASSSRSSTGTRAPALADRRRGSNGLLLPEVVTVRSLVISVVVLLAVVLLLPTVRAYVNQTGELRALRAEVAAAEAERDELEVQLGRWDDQAYVVAQARDRLSYVLPGERAWRVVDPETVVDDLDPRTGQPITDGPVGVEAIDGEPWYTSVWRSVQIAGDQPEPGSEPGSDTPAETPSGDTAPAQPTP